MGVGSWHGSFSSLSEYGLVRSLIHRTSLRLALAATLALVVTGLFALTPTHSQQAPREGPEYHWAVVPAGLLQDARIRDAIGQLVDSKEVLRQANVSGALVYAGARVASVGSPQENARLLWAAAGFHDPLSQLAQQRRCRVWTPTPYVNAQEQLPLTAALGRELAISLKTIGIAIDPCEMATSLEDADILIWSSAQPTAFSAGVPPIQLPPIQARPGATGFLIASNRLAVPEGVPRPVRPPVTGDAGLLLTP